MAHFTTHNVYNLHGIYLLYVSNLSSYEQQPVHCNNKIVRSSSTFEQQSSSSLGTWAINRKCSLTLSHSPPSSLHRSITHPLSGSGFVSGVSMCVVGRDMRWIEMSVDWCLPLSLAHMQTLFNRNTHTSCHSGCFSSNNFKTHTQFSTQSSIFV